MKKAAVHACRSGSECQQCSHLTAINNCRNPNDLTMQDAVFAEQSM